MTTNACPNGNTLALLWEPLPDGLPEQVQGGYEVDFAPGMLGDVVREVTPSGETVWEWRSWEHLDTAEDIISHMETAPRMDAPELPQRDARRRPAGELSFDQHRGHR